MRRLITALSIALLFLVTLGGRVEAQSSPSGGPLVSKTFSLSGSGPSGVLALTGGQSVCQVVIETTTAFTGLVMVPQAAGDGPNNPLTWTTVPTIGGGSITTTGAVTPGSITGYGLTNFRVNVSSISSGTVTGVISCTTASGFISNSPVPSVTPSPLGNAPQPTQPTEDFNLAYNSASSILAGSPQWDPFRVDPSHVLETTDGGTGLYRLTAASATACTSLGTGLGRVARIYTASTAITVFPIFYDEGASPTCSAADIVWGDGIAGISAGGVLAINTRLNNGLAYKLSGALTSTQMILITTYGLGL